MRVLWDDLHWALSWAMSVNSDPWRWWPPKQSPPYQSSNWLAGGTSAVYNIMLHNLILLGIICKENTNIVCNERSVSNLPAAECVWCWGPVEAGLVVDQGGGERGVALQLGDQQSARLTNRQNNNKTHHENFAPKMPSIVDTSDNSPACSTCSFLHKSSQREPGLSSADDLPVSRPSEIFHKCVSGWWRSVTLLSEVLSWRRTLSLNLLVLILSATITQVTASESPDRECCDGPKNLPAPPPSPSYPRYNYPPPEVPDFPEYGPHQLPPRVPGYGPGTVE